MIYTSFVLLLEHFSLVRTVPHIPQHKKQQPVLSLRLGCPPDLDFPSWISGMNLLVPLLVLFAPLGRRSFWEDKYLTLSSLKQALSNNYSKSSILDILDCKLHLMPAINWYAKTNLLNLSACSVTWVYMPYRKLLQLLSIVVIVLVSSCLHWWKRYSLQLHRHKTCHQLRFQSCIVYPTQVNNCNKRIMLALEAW